MRYHARYRTRCVQRGQPLGDEEWVESITPTQLESTMRSRGRPRIQPSEDQIKEAPLISDTALLTFR